MGIAATKEHLPYAARRHLFARFELKEVPKFNLRNYPSAFGARVASLWDELLNVRTNACLKSPAVSNQLPSIPELLGMLGEAADEEGLFSRANLGSVYSYIRGCKGLQIPDRFKEHFPSGPGSVATPFGG